MAPEATAAIRVPLEPVSSSNLAAVGYDAVRHILAVQFQSSAAIFHYAGIPDGLYSDFRTAASLGSFFASHIRGKFPAAKMTGPCPHCGDHGWIGETCQDCGTAEYEPEERRGRKFFDPTRVVINEDGEAKSPDRAQREDGIQAEVIFVRKDGWSLGAPLHLMDVARRTWLGSWAEQWLKDPVTGRWERRWPLPKGQTSPAPESAVR